MELGKNVNEQVRIYHHGKSDEMGIRIGTFDINSSRSSNFESVQWRSNELQYGRKKASRIKHELEEQGIHFKKDQDERHTGTTFKHGPLVRPPPGSCSEPNRKVKMGRKETVACKRSLNSGSGRPEID
ncbi:uncharacterized protein TNCV_970331 [Trichonephila clavipes]|nr:uncharacterized protein TNCV_970331 [Trichonephila clavipes]